MTMYVKMDFESEQHKWTVLYIYIKKYFTGFLINILNLEM
jgi:hypothetical protein